MSEQKEDETRNEPKRTPLNCANTQKGKDIEDEDVIHAEGLWFTEEEIKTFGEKSSGACPAHGNCNGCWNSGPVRKKCQECNWNQIGSTPKDNDLEPCGHQVIFVHQKGENIGTERCIMDLEKLAQLFRKGHEIAKVDQMQNWPHTPHQTVWKADVSRLALGGWMPQINRESRKLQEQIFGDQWMTGVCWKKCKKCSDIKKENPMSQKGHIITKDDIITHQWGEAMGAISSLSKTNRCY